MYNPVMYIFLNKELNMSTGKASAQVAHAVAMSLIELNSTVYLAKWVASPHRTVIVLEGRSEAHMRSIKDYLSERDVPTSMIIDEGVNEIAPLSITAMATRIMDKDSEKTKMIMSSFKLYKNDDIDQRTYLNTLRAYVITFGLLILLGLVAIIVGAIK